MKLLVLLLSSCLAVAGSPARENTDSINPMAVAASAQELFSSIRREVANGLEAKLTNKTVLSADFASILTMLDVQTNKLARAAFDQKLSLAAEQMEKIPKQAGELLRDPRNKQVAATLDPQKWLDEILRQKTTAKVLQDAMGRLRGALAELQAWSKALEPLAPADEISSRLKTRLTELKDEWQNDKPTTPPETKKAEAQTGERVEQNTAEPSGDAPVVADTEAVKNSAEPLVQVQLARADGSVYKTITVSPGVVAVIKMMAAGKSESQICRFIDRSDSPFSLSADQIVAIRDVIKPRLVSAMISRDAALRANGGRRS